MPPSVPEKIYEASTQEADHDKMYNVESDRDDMEEEYLNDDDVDMSDSTRDDQLTHQKMYRERRRIHEMLLEKDVKTVKVRNRALQLYCDTLRDSLLLSKTHYEAKRLDIAQQYVSLFRHGYVPHGIMSKKQKDFLNSFAMPNVAVIQCLKELSGGAGILSQWKKYYYLHGPMIFKALWMQVHGQTSDIVRIHFECRARITRASVRAIYPCMMHNEVLVQRVIGKELVIRGNKTFHFVQSKIVKVDACTNLTFAWNSVLDSLDEVNEVLKDTNKYLLDYLVIKASENDIINIAKEENSPYLCNSTSAAPEEVTIPCVGPKVLPTQQTITDTQLDKEAQHNHALDDKTK